MLLDNKRIDVVVTQRNVTFIQQTEPHQLSIAQLF